MRLSRGHTTPLAPASSRSELFCEDLHLTLRVHHTSVLLSHSPNSVPDVTSPGRRVEVGDGKREGSAAGESGATVLAATHAAVVRGVGRELPGRALLSAVREPDTPFHTPLHTSHSPPFQTPLPHSASRMHDSPHQSVAPPGGSRNQPKADLHPPCAPRHLMACSTDNRYYRMRSRQGFRPSSPRKWATWSRGQSSPGLAPSAPTWPSSKR